MIKIYDPRDPKLASEEATVFIRKEFHVVAIEDLGPDSYFIMKARPSCMLNDHGLQLIVKQKNLAREIFSNYDDAMQVINRVKEAAYGR